MTERPARQSKGNPPKGNPRPKTEQLQIRVTAREKAAIRARAERAGMDVSAYMLHHALPQPARVFQEICSRLRQSGGQVSFALAELTDLLTSMQPNELAITVEEKPAVSLDPFEAAYVAALVEQATELQGLPPPPWTAAVPALEYPWFASSLVSLKLHLLTASPPPFLKRNIFVDVAIGGRV